MCTHSHCECPKNALSVFFFSFWEKISPLFIRGLIIIPVSTTGTFLKWRHEIYSFPLFVFHFYIDAVHNSVCLFWFMNQRSCWEKSFLVQSHSCDLYSIPLSSPFFFKHILCPLKACYCFITLWLVIEPLDMLPTSWLSKAISFSCRSDPIVTDIRPGH